MTGQRDGLEQLWWTRSKVGLTGKPGFQVRASTEGLVDKQGELFRSFYPERAYTITPGVPSRSIPTDKYPLCLALVERNGIRMLFQKKYTGDDGAGRQGNYFLHAIIDVPKSISPLQAINLWDSDFWADRDTLDDPRQLRLDPVAYARLEEAASGHETRWRLHEGDIASAALVIHRLLHGRPADGGHLYIIGPPNRVAGLVHAAVESLPSQLVSDLTFSTFESDPQASTATIVGTCWQAEGEHAVDDPSGKGLPRQCSQPPNESVNLFAGSTTFDRGEDAGAGFAWWAASRLASTDESDRISVRRVREQVAGVSADAATMRSNLTLLYRLSPSTISTEEVDLAIQSSVDLWWELVMDGVKVREALAEAAVRLRPGLNPTRLDQRFQMLLSEYACWAVFRAFERDLEVAAVLLAGAASLPETRLAIESALWPRRKTLSLEQRRMVRRYLVALLDDRARRGEWFQVESVDELREILASAYSGELKVEAVTQFLQSSVAMSLVEADRWRLTLEFLATFELALQSLPSMRQAWLRVSTVAELMDILGNRNARGPLVEEATRMFFATALYPLPDERWRLTRAFAEAVDRGLNAAETTKPGVRGSWLDIPDDMLESVLDDAALDDRRTNRQLRAEVARNFVSKAASQLPAIRRLEITHRYSLFILPALRSVDQFSRDQWLSVSSCAELALALDMSRLTEDMKNEIARRFFDSQWVLQTSADEVWSLASGRGKYVVTALEPGIQPQPWLVCADLDELRVRLEMRGVPDELKVYAIQRFVSLPKARNGLLDPWKLVLDHQRLFLTAFSGWKKRARIDQFLSSRTQSVSIEAVIRFLWRCPEAEKAYDVHVSDLSPTEVERLVEPLVQTVAEATRFVRSVPGGLLLARRYVEVVTGLRTISSRQRSAVTALSAVTDLGEVTRARAFELLRELWFGAAHNGIAPVDQLAGLLSSYFPDDHYRYDADVSDAVAVIRGRAACERSAAAMRAMADIARYYGRQTKDEFLGLIDDCVVRQVWQPIVCLVEWDRSSSLGTSVRDALRAARESNPELAAILDAKPAEQDTDSAFYKLFPVTQQTQEDEPTAKEAPSKRRKLPFRRSK